MLFMKKTPCAKEQRWKNSRYYYEASKQFSLPELPGYEEGYVNRAVVGGWPKPYRVFSACLRSLLGSHCDALEGMQEGLHHK